MIKLSDITKLIIEADTYKARSKETGRVVVFKSQDSYDAAVKGGSHEPVGKPSKTKDKSKAPEKKIIEKKDPASEKSAVKKEDKKK